MGRNKKEFLVVDLEMTCEEHREKGYQPEIIEIGLVRVSYQGEILGKEQYYIKPKHNKISDYCTKLTGITPQLIKEKGIPLAEAFNKMKKLGSRNKVLVAWGEDWLQFEMESEWKNLELPISQSRLNLSLVNSIFSKTSDKIALEDAFIQWGVVPEGKMHSGVDDALNTAKVLQKMIEKMNL